MVSYCSSSCPVALLLVHSAPDTLACLVFLSHLVHCLAPGLLHLLFHSQLALSLTSDLCLNVTYLFFEPFLTTLFKIAPSRHPWNIQSLFGLYFFHSIWRLDIPFVFHSYCLSPALRMWPPEEHGLFPLCSLLYPSTGTVFGTWKVLDWINYWKLLFTSDQWFGTFFVNVFDLPSETSGIGQNITLSSLF